MSDDDFLERTRRTSLNWTGEEWGPEQVLADFQLHGHARRSAILDMFDNELRESSPSNIQKAARMVSLRRKMGDFHHAARKVGK